MPIKTDNIFIIIPIGVFFPPDRYNGAKRGPPYFLFSLYRLSGVPSFLVWVVAGAALAASLLALYRISALPSFFVGPAVAEAVTALGEAVAVAGLVAEVAGLAAVDASFFFGVAGVVWAIECTLKPARRKRAKKIFFIMAILFWLIYEKMKAVPNDCGQNAENEPEIHLFNCCLTNFVILRERNDLNFAF
jgi:hypothetical protein